MSANSTSPDNGTILTPQDCRAIMEGWDVSRKLELLRLINQNAWDFHSGKGRGWKSWISRITMPLIIFSSLINLSLSGAVPWWGSCLIGLLIWQYLEGDRTKEQVEALLELNEMQNDSGTVPEIACENIQPIPPEEFVLQIRRKSDLRQIIHETTAEVYFGIGADLAGKFRAFVICSAVFLLIFLSAPPYKLIPPWSMWLLVLALFNSVELWRQRRKSLAALELFILQTRWQPLAKMEDS